VNKVKGKYEGDQAHEFIVFVCLRNSFVYSRLGEFSIAIKKLTTTAAEEIHFI
jgi:hypothetical protein